MIYFDNSATSFYKPKEVINAVVNTVKFVSANPGRGGHKLALSASKIVYSVRKRLSDYLGFDRPERVIFTPGCTYALNQAIFGLNLKNKHVVTTPYEHNSVLRPLFALKNNGLISLTIAKPNALGQITAESITRCLTDKTALVVVNHVSNVTGISADVAEIGKACRSLGALLLVDGAQSVGHIKINLLKDCIDMLAVAPHKGLHSVSGVGALIVGERVRLHPIIYGGTGTSSFSITQPTDYPEGFEAGTLNLPAIAGLGRAIDAAKADERIRQKKISLLVNKITGGLENFEKVRLFSPKSSPAGIICFAVRGFNSEEVAQILSDEYGVCVRSGLHCAPLAHKMLGTENCGLVRASLGFDNTDDEANVFLEAIGKICGQ